MTLSRQAVSENYWQRSFGAAIPEVTAAAEWIDSIAAALPISDSQLFAMQVCLEELMLNIVLHGGKGDPLTISIAVQALPDRVVMTVDDDGRAFDLEHAPGKAIDRPLNQVKPGGLGIHLIKSFATSLHYDRTPTGNRVVLEFAG
jgi:anti-sigma regulatory factor (Ser/Thr protein kinase)